MTLMTHVLRKRNIRRFPPDFMFQLNKEEFEKLRNDLIFQNGISNWGGTRKLPYAFTEQGLAMLSGILKNYQPRIKNNEVHYSNIHKNTDFLSFGQYVLEFLYLCSLKKKKNRSLVSTKNGRVKN